MKSESNCWGLVLDIDRRWRRRLLACVASLATLALMVLTEPRMAIVWDEGYTLGRENRIRLWFQALADPVGFSAKWVPPNPMTELVQQDAIRAPRPEQIDTRAKLFEPEVIAWFWPFAREEPHGHPPFYAIVGLIGDLVVPTWAELPRARFGPMLVFSLTAGCLFGFTARRSGLLIACLATGAWSLQPQLFGHAHYAAYDALLTCLWVNAIIAFQLAAETDDEKRPIDRVWWIWAIGLGIIFGCAADTKLTGWFLPLPFLVWSVAYRSRHAFRVAMIAAPVAIVTLYLANPGWWASPLGGIVRFLQSNLTRGKSIPIEVLFLGKVYNTPVESLPWYNTIVWTLMAAPVGFLVLALIGTVSSLRSFKRESFGVLVVLHWAFLLALRALPHTPGHDGVRLFLPAFGMVAMLAGQGGNVVSSRSIKWGRIVIGAALIEGLVSVLAMMPVPLSYFSPIVGGLPGATAIGMEPTYYWDSLDTDALDYLNTHTQTGEVVQFATFPHSFMYLRQTGQLKAPIVPFDRGKTRWLVFQNRPGAMRADVKALIRASKPAFVHEKFGIPLLWIIPANPSAQP